MGMSNAPQDYQLIEGIIQTKILPLQAIMLLYGLSELRLCSIHGVLVSSRTQAACTWVEVWTWDEPNVSGEIP